MTRPRASWFRDKRRSDQRNIRRLLAIVDELRESLSAGRARDVERVLHPRVTLVVDGGGRAPAPTETIRDRKTVASTLLALFGPTIGSTSTVVSANGTPALAFARDGRVIGILTARARGDRAAEVWVVVNPDKLRHWNPA
jgi:RNA polymerase sigma-70 factor (ECF subfamily)